MLRPNPIEVEKIWGKESWVASTLPNGLQEDLKAYVGGDYPLLVKTIQAEEALAMQVHPDDEKAGLYEQSLGGTKCWYVLSADEGSRIVYGLNGVYTASELRMAVEAGNLADCLRYVDVSTGDFIYLPAGTVHSFVGGMRLLEIRQASDVAYRLFDYERGRECYVERAISCIKSDMVRNVTKAPGAFSCPYFTLEDISVEDEYSGSADKAPSKRLPCDYNLLYVIEGSGTINGESAGDGDLFVLEPGESFDVSGEFHLLKIIPAGPKHR